MKLFIATLGLILFLIPFAAYWNSQAAGTISGRVFQDYNGNGNYDTSGTSPNFAIDTGMSGVTVTVYDASGTARGTVNSAANGTYSIAATGTGPYRVEFTNLPSGYFPSARSTDSVSGGTASNSGSTVQFIADGNTSNVNLAISFPTDYSQNNPTLVSNVHRYGNQISGPNNATSALIGFPYSSGADWSAFDDTVPGIFDSPTTHAVSITANQIGTTWGLGYDRQARRIYAASYFKRHSGFGRGLDNTINTADDAGAIYVINPATNVVTNTFTVPSATTNSHNTANYLTDNGNAGWDAVGKTSLGGMDLSDDATSLYVMNLQNRTLYRLNPTTGASLTSQAVPLTPPGCSATGDVRPFAVKYYRGQVYVGMVCSAESTQSAANLRAYVYTANPTSLAFSASPVLNIPLNYIRGNAHSTPSNQAEWLPWRTTFGVLVTPDIACYPQPMLTGITFDNENMVLGIADRSGDQIGNSTQSNQANSTLYVGAAAGDTLKACGNPTSGWTLESNGRCGGTGTAPQNSGQGPSNGEFYFNDDYGGEHHEVSVGGVANLPGSGQIITTTYDPINYDSTSYLAFYDVGFRWYNSTSGAATRQYRLIDGAFQNVNDSGKGNGLGDIEILSDPAPIEIGNRVWRDTDNDGVQDAGELPIAGVTVRLYNSSNVLIATAVTDANGEYYFTSGSAADGNTTDNIGIVNGQILPNTNYQIRFDRAADYTLGGALFGLFLSPVNSTIQNGDDDSNDSDATNVTNPTGSPAGTFPVIAVTTGNAGQNNHTLDVGFKLSPTSASVSVGGRIQSSDGRGIRNVIVGLTLADGTYRWTRTGSFGYYNFESITTGQTVVVSVSSKRFTFAPREKVLQLEDSVANFDFTAEAQSLLTTEANIQTKSVGKK